MALLSNLIDIVHASRVGDNLTGVTLATFNHSLATVPDICFPVLRSVAAIGIQPSPAIGWVGANVSINTVLFAMPSTSSAPTFSFDLVTQFYHTIIR